MEPGTPTVIGVIGGSGIYEIDGFTNARWERMSTPFGEPSDHLLFGELEGQPMVFLPRHGRGHSSACLGGRNAAFVYLATAERTTAAVLTVDGGNIAASVR